MGNSFISVLGLTSGRGLFIVVYNLKVPPERAARYIQIEREMAGIYSEHGCLGVEIYRDAADPQNWMEVYRFRDKEHYEEVVNSVGRDPRMESLTRAFTSLIDGEENRPRKGVFLRML